MSTTSRDVGPKLSAGSVVGEGELVSLTEVIGAVFALLGVQGRLFVPLLQTTRGTYVQLFVHPEGLAVNLMLLIVMAISLDQAIFCWAASMRTCGNVIMAES